MSTLLLALILWLGATPQGVSAQSLLENPQALSVQSGIGVISGWVCAAALVEIEFDGGNTLEAAYGTERNDTLAACGDVNNGFGLLINWNLLGDGVHTLRALRDGIEFAQVAIIVSSFGEEFLSGVTGQYALAGFPEQAQTTSIEWQQTLQNFVITSGENSGGGSSGAGMRVLENPQPGSFHSGLGVISGFACAAGKVEIEFDGGNTLEAGYGTERNDTLGTCGDVNNGFGLLINWNVLGPGEHTVRALVDGVEFAQVTIVVTTFGTEFLQSVSGDFTLEDFLSNGTDARVRWQESLQNFVMVGVVPNGGDPSLCDSGQGTASDGSGGEATFEVTNSCASAGDTVEMTIFPFPGSAQKIDPDVRAQTGLGGFFLCATDLQMRQAGNIFTADDFQFLAGDGNPICREVQPGEQLRAVLIANKGSGLNFNTAAFQLAYRGEPVLSFGATTSPLSSIFPIIHPAYTVDANAAIPAGATGQVLGDPAPGKLMPFYSLGGHLVTIIGMTNTLGAEATSSDTFATVRVTIFDVTSTPQTSLQMCLSPSQSGVVVLQEGLEGPQIAQCGGQKTNGQTCTLTNIKIAPQGYVTLAAQPATSDCSPTTGGTAQIATWTDVFDIGTGSFGFEIMTPTAVVDPASGQARGGIGAVGLIPSGNTVISRFETIFQLGVDTSIFVWLASNADSRSSQISAFLNCENGTEVSTALFLPSQLTLIDPASLSGIEACVQSGEFRGVLRFRMPDAGVVWSQISQSGFNYSEDFLGANLEPNTFIPAATAGHVRGDPAPGKLVPLYQADSSLATFVGIQNTTGAEGPSDSEFVSVHVTVFNDMSIPQTSFDLCLPPFEFGFVLLQQAPASASQLRLCELGGNQSPKCAVLSTDNDDLPSSGYITLAAQPVLKDCLSPISAAAQIVAWTSILDIVASSISVELPTPTAVVNPADGQASGGPGAVGLTPGGNNVIVPYEINPQPALSDVSSIHVWLASTGGNRPTVIPALLICENGLELQTSLSLPLEVNSIDPATLSGIEACLQAGQYRGAVRFKMPDAGIAWADF